MCTYYQTIKMAKFINDEIDILLDESNYSDDSDEYSAWRPNNKLVH